LTLVLELRQCEVLEMFVEALIMGAHPAAAGGEHLVKKIFRVVTFQHPRPWRQFGLGGHFTTLQLTFFRFTSRVKSAGFPANSGKNTLFNQTCLVVEFSRGIIVITLSKLLAEQIKRRTIGLRVQFLISFASR